MSQLTVYIDSKTIKKIESAAKTKNTSISKWVKEQLERSLENTWPEGYFDLLGSLKDTNLERPDKPPFSHDNKRMPL